MNLPITSLLTGVGIGGLAVALAAQDTVKNVFGSFTVILDQPFDVGDWVVVEGIEGVVAEVGFRSTKILTFYNSIVTLPNSNLINASVDNYGAREFRRWSTRLGVENPQAEMDAFPNGVVGRSHLVGRRLVAFMGVDRLCVQGRHDGDGQQRNDLNDTDAHVRSPLQRGLGARTSG